VLVDGVLSAAKSPTLPDVPRRLLGRAGEGCEDARMSDEKDTPVPKSFGGDMTGPFASYIGLEFTEVTPDRVVGTWKAREELHQPYGILHGGVHCAVVETLASVAAATWFEQGQVVGVNNNTDFYKAVSEGTITSTATPLHRGKSQQVWVVESVDADGTVVARGQVRLQNLSIDRRTIGNIR
jgi:1,4-dihydroxy-2-naphthoyl-CoA hydrolase